MESLAILDTTLRDGDQAAGFAFDPKMKPTIALALSEAGVDVIEAGFPCSSPVDFDACRNVVAALCGGSTAVALMCRSVPEEIRRTAGLLSDNGILHVSLPVSDRHIATLQGTNPLDVNRTALLEKAAKDIAFAVSLSDRVEVGAEDASCADVDFLCDYCNCVIAAGASIVNIADTQGLFVPSQVTELVGTLLQNVPGFTDGSAVLSIHCHNDGGLALANTLAAVHAGARQAEVTINGIGERAGNTALEELVFHLSHHRDLYNVETQIRQEKIPALSRMVCQAASFSPGPMKPFVGWNIRAHASGIHQKNLSAHSFSGTEKQMTLESFPPQRVVLSRHSGRAGVILAASEYGLHLTNDCADKILMRIKSLPERTVSGSQFLTLIEQTLPQNDGENVAYFVCTDFVLKRSDEKCHVLVTLSDQLPCRSPCETNHRTFSGAGATSMEAVLDVVQKIAGFSVKLIIAEWTGINDQCRCYVELQLPDGKTDAVEQIGTFPERLFFECCLDIINRFRPITAWGIEKFLQD